MRVLCLHGAGTSAAIFKSQTAAFRSKLGPDYTFEFIDGPFPAPAAPGIPVLYNSPTYVWYPQQTVPHIRAAHRRLLNYLAEKGPYDALCCFSQGCALVSSLLLYHACETPDEPLPFRSVVFICGGVPLPALEDLGLPVSPRARRVNEQTAAALHHKASRLAHLAAHLDEIRPGIGLWDYDTAGLLHDASVAAGASSRPPFLDETDVFGIDFSRVPAEMRITIPTVHVYGAKDPRWPSAMQLACFCRDPKIMYDHGGGHDIPRSSHVSEAISSFFRELPRLGD